ncbi:MAG: putative lipopolysaccharide heptosyltransferase [Betaproteobacteria bacterium]|nr:putative lipopolysaccharide heptosyltransferase [Betaproteobacteria bacterium]
MKPPARVLVVVTRRIGDVLLTTPLIRSLKRAWPQAAIDVLIFAGTEGVLAANRDIRHVLTVAERPTAIEHLALAASIFRRYDLALSAVPSDRPTVYAWLAAPVRAGFVVDEPKQRWKKRLLGKWVAFDNRDTHTVLMCLKLAAVFGVEPCYDVVAACTDAECAEVVRQLPFMTTAPYAVFHTYPKFNYKMWRREAWIELAGHMQKRGMQIVLTGSRDSAEVAYVEAIARDIPGAFNVTGKLTLAQTACMLREARAYVGPDTAITHMAAAVGVPVVALYGPSNPVKWGPWPQAFATPVNPWRRLGTQRVNNVTLIQGAEPCVPCFHEGCDRHIGSFSDCLQHMPVARVAAALDAALKI